MSEEITSSPAQDLPKSDTKGNKGSKSTKGGKEVLSSEDEGPSSVAQKNILSLIDDEEGGDDQVCNVRLQKGSQKSKYEDESEEYSQPES